MLVLIILFKIDVRWASLVNDMLDVLAILITDVGRYLFIRIAFAFLDSPTYLPLRYQTTMPVLRP